MKYTRKIAVLLAAVLLLGGCSTGKPAGAPETTAAAQTTMEVTTAEVVTEPGTEESGAEECTTEEAVTEEIVTEEAADPETMVDEDGMGILMSAFPVNDVDLEIAEVENRELSEEEAEEMDRSMRAYTAPKDSLLINKAKKYYYYDQLDAELKELYDTILMGTEDPEYANSRAMMITGRNPYDSSFWDWYNIAYTAVILDHPERFWMYNHQPDTPWVAYRNSDIPGKYEIYVYLDGPVKDYRARQTTFNQAAKAFLSGIDTGKSKKEVAKAIHDKLTDLVSYDHPVCDQNLGSDIAHTAYGALVASSTGKKNHAVCDGYAQAFEYLCQQVGIEATVIVGKAGNTPQTAGAHAWSLVKVDDKWREVDACWDDVGTIAEQLDKNSKWYKYQKEALNNDKYGSYLKHHMFLISTDAIRNFNPGDKARYKTKDGKYWVSLVGESVHIRYNRGECGWGDVVALAPKAK